MYVRKTHVNNEMSEMPYGQRLHEQVTHVTFTIGHFACGVIIADYLGHF